ncbi:MAG: EscU/YscU/HrcU family type III secretion system export apparatus switch protein [Spirochaetales bacterium]|jgi:type III secretion system FlhB-like substrate exporter|nr:EscU/YscU/HrcU family type III secretion system export apparatus switch protein [Spirochaetales bacterium]
MEKAVALKYDTHLPAPFVLAKGKGEIAEKIIALAHTAGVAVVSLPLLAEELFILSPGSFIPEDCFEIVAEMLAYVHAVSGRLA